MYVRDRMSTPVVTIGPDMVFQQALKLLQERAVRRLPVINPDGQLIGVVTDRDLIQAALHYVGAEVEIEDVMTTTVITIAPDTPLTEAALLMIGNKIGGLPVVDEQHRVIGIITESDIFKTFVELMSSGAIGGVRAVGAGDGDLAG